MALIFFDFDGVLVDSLENEGTYFARACQQVGITQITSSRDMASLSEGNFYEECERRGIDLEQMNEAMAIYGRKLEDADYHVDAYPEPMEALRETAAHFPVYIVSSNTSESVHRTLREQKIDTVKAVLGADVESSKVKKFEQIKAEYPGERTYLITDTSGDIMEAREAQLDVVVGVTWGWHAPEVVRAAKPDYIFDEPSQLTDFLRKISD